MPDSLKFGTSGLRGLAVDLLGPPSARYTLAFIAYLKAKGRLAPDDSVMIGQDLRDSSPAIAGSVAGAIASAGLRPLDCGQLATPALALAARQAGTPAIMVTGSHIPADRNGLKFYLADGEIGKDDEAGIVAALDPMASIAAGSAVAEKVPEARLRYIARYTAAFGPEALAGWRIGLFEHSSVGRDDLAEILAGCGAEVVRLGRVSHFVPIDTEAVEPATGARIAEWVRANRLNALVSTDGDADRPLLADEHGTLLRGDMLGILTAQFVHADALVTPVTSNSAIEGLGRFARVIRTRVGSPYVIEGMAAARAAGASVVVGFEANGGFLLDSDISIDGRPLSALPTRDAVLPMLAVLASARAAGKTVSELVATLPARAARSDRLERVPQARTAELLAELEQPQAAARFFEPIGAVSDISMLDGLRFVLEGGEVVHYRASGNAPELRCYTEAATPARADALLAWGLEAAARRVRR